MPGYSLTLGSIFASVGCLCAASVFILIRKLAKTPYYVVIFWFSLISVILGFSACYFLNVLTAPESTLEYIYLVAIGVCGTFGQLFMTISLKIEDAGPVSLGRSIDVVITYIYQVTLLKEPTSWLSLVGAVIILSAVFVTAIWKWHASKPELFSCLKCSKGSTDFEKHKYLEHDVNSNGISTISIDVIQKEDGDEGNEISKYEYTTDMTTLS